MTQHILITNDDGIDSAFLKAIARALGRQFRLSIAAPASEQSWIGRAVTRQGEITVEDHPEYDCPAWTISGTPTDCVNIALGNLMDEMPDAVVSGINIGYNTSTPMIYSSGTVAGAMEGAFWGLPAFALSQQVPDHIFGSVTESKGQLEEPYQSTLDKNASHAAELIAAVLEGSSKAGNGSVKDAIVHNLNYPMNPEQPYRTVITVPAPLREVGLYARDHSSVYSFRFQHGNPLDSDHLTDRDAIDKGLVSHSVLNFSTLGRDLNH